MQLRDRFYFDRVFIRKCIRIKNVVHVLTHFFYWVPLELLKQVKAACLFNLELEAVGAEATECVIQVQKFVDGLQNGQEERSLVRETKSVHVGVE